MRVEQVSSRKIHITDNDVRQIKLLQQAHQSSLGGAALYFPDHGLYNISSELTNAIMDMLTAAANGQDYALERKS